MRMRALFARLLFFVALVLFRLSMKIAGGKVYLVHVPALRASASDRYTRLVEKGEWLN
jgi:hypothetical protein